MMLTHPLWLSIKMDEAGAWGNSEDRDVFLRAIRMIAVEARDRAQRLCSQLDRVGGYCVQRFDDSLLAH
jgi:hypothetical protein